MTTRLRLLRLTVLPLIALGAGALQAGTALNQTCTETQAAGLNWEGGTWVPRVFDLDSYTIADAPPDTCFRFGREAEKGAMEAQATYWNAPENLEFFKDYTVECLARTRTSSRRVEMFACLRKVRMDDGQVSYDCRGTSWNDLTLVPGMGFHASTISGAVDPTLDSKPEMVISAGTCTAN